MEMQFFEAVANRRSYYAIGKEKIVPEDKIQEIVNVAVKHIPSSFNSQTGRVVILFNKNHLRLWEIVKEELRKILSDTNYNDSKEKIEHCFASGYGTILFFEDYSVIEDLQKQFQLYKDNFPIWSHHSSGMLQFTIWTALEMNGLGATLQHYNPLIDDAVKKQWSIPEKWKLIAQMPFGNPLEQPGEKEYKSIADRVKIYR